MFFTWYCIFVIYNIKSLKYAKVVYSRYMLFNQSFIVHSYFQFFLLYKKLTNLFFQIFLHICNHFIRPFRIGISLTKVAIMIFQIELGSDFLKVRILVKTANVSFVQERKRLNKCTVLVKRIDLEIIL